MHIIVKIGSEQVEQMSFYFFFCLIRYSKCEKKFFSDYWIIHLLDVAFVVSEITI